MHNKTSFFLKSLAMAMLASPIVVQSAPPAILGHQGRIIESGINYDGTGYFKLAFVDAAGTTTLWSNDGTSTGGSEPTAAVTVSVSKGLYGIPIGDTTFDAQMTSIPPSVFTDNDDVYLRLWFSTDNVTFELLSPDQRLTAAPYALSSNQAQAVVLGGVTAEMLAPVAVQDSIEATGELGIGRNGNPIQAKLHLGSHPLLAEIVDGVGGFTALENPSSVFVAGNVAYVTSILEDSLTLIDVSNPVSPALLSELRDGVGGFNHLNNAYSVFVSGDFAYVVATLDNALSVIDVSDPASPKLESVVVLGSGDLVAFTSPWTVKVSGSRAFVGCATGLVILDVTDPSSPAYLGGLKGTDNVIGIDIQDNLLAFADYDNGWIKTVDITDPASPAVLATLDSGSGFSSLTAVASIDIVGNVLFAAAFGSDALNIIDITNPNAPTLIKVLIDNVDGFNGLNGAASVSISDDFAFVAASLENALSIIDMSNPSTPLLVAQLADDAGGFNKLLGANWVHLENGLAYVTGGDDDSLVILDPSRLLQPDLVATNRIGIGTTNPIAALDVRGDVHISGALLDRNISPGNPGQVLFAKDNAIEWGYLSPENTTDELQSLFFLGDTLGITGGNSVSLASYFKGDGSETFNGELVVSTSVTSPAYNFSSSQSFRFKVPGNAMHQSSEDEQFFKSSIGFIRPDGTDTRFIGTAPVHLPHGAVITGYDIMYYDNAAAANWADFTTRLRRRHDTNFDAQNIAVLNVSNPASPNTASIIVASDNPASFEQSRATVDNMNYSYYVSLDCTVSAVNTELRFYGFRINYTLQELNP